MSEISIRDLRNHGGDVIDRVEAGERLTVTRDGRPVAELRPLPSRAKSAISLLASWSRVPAIDPRRLQADLDRVVDPRV
ncbi:MAG TPA: type II toxin-antitoxin system prevent-host-death family antitoxin [Candidatus Dormibacteraeota bacterium]|nr:type II toxin-antitoxin system prevent-host-death family antitoxin [Candidatus Dormibacteraeota bacterium]